MGSESLRVGVKRRLTIARREIASLRSEKTIILALIIQLFIAAFSSFLVVGLVSLYNPSSVPGGEITFGVTGDAGNELASAIDDKERWEIRRYADFESAMESFRSGEVNAVFNARKLENGKVNVTAIAPESSLRTTLVVVQIKDALEEFERYKRDQLSSRLEKKPVSLPPETDSSPYFGFTYTVLIPLLMFLPVFISGSIVSDSITEEFERGTLELLRVSPLSELTIIDGKMIAMTLLVPAQTAVWLSLLMLNGTTIANPLEIIAMMTAFALAVVTIGSVVGLRFRDRRQSQFIYSTAIIVVFGVVHLLPETPSNTIAKLSIGSPTLLSHLMVAIYVLGAVCVYVGARFFVRERGLS
ncbi:MAG: ABC transporter permease [Halobacteria archaeon]|nr:ABC transporter permease [Halobacteria archaeon]